MRVKCEGKMREAFKEADYPSTVPVKSDGAADELKAEYEALKHIVEVAYQEGVTIPEAEKLAARFLNAQLMIAEELAAADLDSRMQKNGVKALKAAVWLTAATKDEKKPSDTWLNCVVDKDAMVQAEQQKYDKADSHRESLAVYLSIFKDAHIYFRGIAKGKYE